MKIWSQVQISGFWHLKSYDNILERIHDLKTDLGRNEVDFSGSHPKKQKYDSMT